MYVDIHPLSNIHYLLISFDSGLQLHFLIMECNFSLINSSQHILNIFIRGSYSRIHRPKMSHQCPFNKEHCIKL